MALVRFPNNNGIILSPMPVDTMFFDSTSQASLNAAGESVAFIGHMFLSSGPGTSKTFSSAGSKVYWASGSNTFNNGGTTVRIGLQDVAASGLEDGTFDAYGELVGGVDSFNSALINTLTISSGTKTVAHGDLIAVCFELMSWAGSDVVPVRYGPGTTPTYGFPYVTVDSGAGPAKLSIHPNVTIEFDDGTIGWLGAGTGVLDFDTGYSFNSGTSPDEYALVFQVPFTCSISSLFAVLVLDSTDDFELILYSDPLGTPTAVRTVTQSALQMQSGGSTLRASEFAISETTLTANTDYAIALRATTANNMSFKMMQMNGIPQLRLATPLGTDWYLASRTNQTGAFSSAQTDELPMFGFRISKLDDGIGSGGGSFVF